MTVNRRYHRDAWPIAAAMIQYPNVRADGSSVQDQPAEAWAATLADVTEAGCAEAMPRGAVFVSSATMSPQQARAVDILVKGMGIVIDMARDLRFPVPVAGSVLQMYLMSSAAGLGRRDDSTVARLYAQVAGVALPGMDGAS